MNNVPIFSICEHIIVGNAITTFTIEVNPSNLRKHFKVHYIIENIEEYNVAEERYRPVSIIEESNSKRRIYKTTRIPLTPLKSNTFNILSPQPPIQPSPTNSQFRRLNNIIKSCRTWKFDKENSSNHPL